MAKAENIIPYIKEQEGGLSRATTDTASKNPAPWAYNGKTGWHTNMGVTYQTFSSLSSKLGYANTPDNFFKMPESIWLKIYRYGYWDPMQGDLYKSQAIANAVVDFAWASGTGGATKALIKYLKGKGINASNAKDVANAFNSLTVGGKEKKEFDSLIDFRKQYFLSLNQPANNKGWLSRMDALRKQGYSILGKSFNAMKAHPLVVGVIILGIAISAYYLFINKKTRI